MDFNFVGYLEKLYPGVEFEIEELTAGIVNWTVRAKRKQDIGDSSSVYVEKSIVLKHAPPYVAKRGPYLPFSEARQFTEANALAALYQARDELKQSVGSSDLFPTVVNLDQESHVLILNDLGPGDDLMTYLKSLRGEDTVTDKLRETWLNVGSQVGHFLAKLHSSNVLRSSTLPSKEDYAPLSLIHRTLVQPIPNRIAPFVTHDEVSTLYQRIEEDFLREDESQELSFTHGDCYAPCIYLVNRGIPRVIDWEFASTGRGPHGDVALLLAHLHGRLIFQESCGENVVVAGIKALIQSITAAYRNTSTQLHNLWTEVGSKDLEKQRLMAKIARSAFILHGRELINNTIDEGWECRCCSASKGFPKGCVARRAIIEKGIFYVRAARENVESFAKSNHLEAVAQEDNVLLPLFTDYNTNPLA